MTRGKEKCKIHPSQHLIQVKQTRASTRRERQVLSQEVFTIYGAGVQKSEGWAEKPRNVHLRARAWTKRK